MTEATEPVVDPPLVAGLRPFRDRYLVGVLGRMTQPILQMFPEVDGYTGIYFISLQ